MSRPYKDHWLFDGHDPDDFFAADVLPCDEAWFEFLDDVYMQHGDPDRPFSVHAAPLAHLLPTKRRLEPGKVTHPSMQERFVTRWAAYFGRVILVLEASDQEGNDARIAFVREDVLVDLPDLVADALGNVDAAEALPNLGTTHGAVSVMDLTASNAWSFLALAGTGTRLLVPRRRFESWSWVAVPAGATGMELSDLVDRHTQAQRHHEAGVTTTKDSATIPEAYLAHADTDALSYLMRHNPFATAADTDTDGGAK